MRLTSDQSCADSLVICVRYEDFRVASQRQRHARYMDICEDSDGIVLIQHAVLVFRPSPRGR